MWLEIVGGIAIGASIAAIVDALKSTLDEQVSQEEKKT
jgi:hypothetical protein